MIKYFIVFLLIFLLRMPALAVLEIDLKNGSTLIVNHSAFTYINVKD